MQDLGKKLLSLGAKRFVDKGGEPQEIVKLSGRESRRYKFTHGLKRRTSIRSQPSVLGCRPASQAAVDDVIWM